MNGNKKKILRNDFLAREQSIEWSWTFARPTRKHFAYSRSKNEIWKIWLLPETFIVIIKVGGCNLPREDIWRTWTRVCLYQHSTCRCGPDRWPPRTRSFWFRPASPLVFEATARPWSPPLAVSVFGSTILAKRKNLKKTNYIHAHNQIRKRKKIRVYTRADESRKWMIYGLICFSISIIFWFDWTEPFGNKITLHPFIF